MAKKKYDWKPLIEAIKEPLRLLVLAVIPFAISYVSEFGYEWAGVVVVFLRFVDKYLHKSGIAEKGLTRF